MTQRIRGKQVFEGVLAKDMIKVGSGALQNAFPISCFDPRYCWQYFEDFIANWVGSAATNMPWIDTAGGSSARSLMDGAGGWLKMYTGASDNNSIEVQGVNEVVLMATAKPMWFECRFKVTDVLHSDLTIGLGIHDTTFQAGSTDGLFMCTPLDAGDGYLHIISRKNSTDTELANAKLLVNDTFLTIGFYFDGAASPTVFPYIDGTQYTAITTNIDDDEELAITLCLQTNTTAAQYLYVDYIFVAQVR